MFDETIPNLLESVIAFILLLVFYNAGKERKKQIRDEDKSDKENPSEKD